jgi:lycopene beta-cyclase
MSIGTLGGQVKPSTGYAFGRIQQDSAHIVQSLSQKGHPFDIPSTPAFYGFCDSLMLQVMADHGAHIKSIFAAMFKNNSIRRIFRFLDEKTLFYENCLLIASLPPRLFLQTLGQSRVLSRLKAIQPDPTLKPTHLGPIPVNENSNI